MKPDLDVVSQFVATMQKYGIGHGFYYTLQDNQYLGVCDGVAGGCGSSRPGQMNVSQDEFEAIAIAQLTELWTNYGNLTEIWFDGGYQGDMKKTLLSLLAVHQPNVVGFNAGGLIPNAARWVGTEGDMESEYYPDGVWSTYCCNNTDGEPCVVAHTTSCSINSGCSLTPYVCFCLLFIASQLSLTYRSLSRPYGGAGCPATGTGDGCNSYYPAALDYTLQTGDQWFYNPVNPTPRPLTELIEVYHNSVGRNTVLELDFAIDRRGKLDPTHKVPNPMSNTNPMSNPNPNPNPNPIP